MVLLWGFVDNTVRWFGRQHFLYWVRQFWGFCFFDFPRAYLFGMPCCGQTMHFVRGIDENGTPRGDS
jgi:hypothetical protein